MKSMILAAILAMAAWQAWAQEVHTCQIEVDGTCILKVGEKPKPSKAEPMDVPAVQVIDSSGFVGSCQPGQRPDLYTYCVQPRWTCDDKRRVLLTSEDSQHHCVLFR